MRGLHAVMFLLMLAAVCSPSSSLRGQTENGEAVAPDTLEAAPDTLRQSPSADSTAEVGPPIIAAVPFPSHATSAGKQDLLEMASSTVGEALIWDSGTELVKLGSPGLPQQVRLEGSAPGQVLCLMDGVPITDPQLETFDLNWLPLASTASVKVAKGGFSSDYGSGASAGVLDVVSVDTRPAVPLSEFRAWWGSFDSRVVGLRVNRLIRSRLGVAGLYENMESGGWRSHSHSEMDRFYGQLSGSVGDRLGLSLAGYRYDGQVQFPDTCPDVAAGGAGSRDDRRDFLRASLVGGKHPAFSLDYYYLDTWQSFASQDSAYVHDGQRHGLDLKLAWQQADSSCTMVGTGFKRREIASTALGDRSSTDMYAYAGRQLQGGPWQVRGDLRIEKNSDFEAQVAAALAACFQAGPGRSFFGRLSRSFAFPSFGQMYYRGPQDPGDSHLEPEHAHQLQLGVLLDRVPFSLSASLYLRKVDNLVLWRTDPSCDLIRTTSGESSVQGLEGILRYLYHDMLEIRISGTINRTRDEYGQRPAYATPRALAWSTRLTKVLTPHLAFGLTFAGRWVPAVRVGSRADSCVEEPECMEDARVGPQVDGLVNAHLAIDRARVFARVKNLFNQETITRWGRPPLPSRSYEFGVIWELVD